MHADRKNRSDCAKVRPAISNTAHSYCMYLPDFTVTDHRSKDCRWVHLFGCATSTHNSNCQIPFQGNIYYDEWVFFLVTFWTTTAIIVFFPSPPSLSASALWLCLLRSPPPQPSLLLLLLLLQCFYCGADKSLARPTSQCILFDSENISFDACLVIFIYSTNIPPIMIINRIYEHQNLLSL